MTTLAPTFVREGNTILAFYEDQLIAQGTVFAKVEESALQYLENLSLDRNTKDVEQKKSRATHIVTPNGLKGEILGNHSGQWGERLITVRLENGRIARFEAHAGNDKEIEYQTVEAAAPASALEYLESTLNETPEGTKESLASRIAALDQLVVAATEFQRHASYEDQRKGGDIVIAAEHEKREVREALAHLQLADAEAFAPPAPFKTGAVEQASLGRGDGTWLDETVNEMVAESASQDFDRLLSEGPGQFVIDLDVGALSDQGITREMALSHIVSKTAGYQGDAIDSYREQFLAKVEQARREELKDRNKTAKKKAEKTAKKEKKAKKLPDDALFL
jgi:hypothetical protein